MRPLILIITSEIQRAICSESIYHREAFFQRLNHCVYQDLKLNDNQGQHNLERWVNLIVSRSSNVESTLEDLKVIVEKLCSLFFVHSTCCLQVLAWLKKHYALGNYLVCRVVLIHPIAD